MNSWKLGAIFIAFIFLVYGVTIVRKDKEELPPIPSPTLIEFTPSPEAPLAEIPLVVGQPKDQMVVSSPGFVVSGQTTPNAEVFVNELETRADSGGNFSLRIPLEEGENYVIVVATDADGQVAEQTLTVTYEPQQ